MDLTHPIDALVRQRLHDAEIHQTAFAKAIGRKPSWLNKYMNGAGDATIDDVIRMLALLIGIETEPLTALERRLVKTLRKIHPERQEDAVAIWENAAKGFPRAQSPESDAQSARRPRKTKSTAHGTR